MSSNDISWNDEVANITDSNERRKVQNRIAQRSYRARQRRRLELAEALLLDLPQKLHHAIGGRSNSIGNDIVGFPTRLSQEASPGMRMNMPDMEASMSKFRSTPSFQDSSSNLPELTFEFCNPAQMTTGSTSSGGSLPPVITKGPPDTIARGTIDIMDFSMLDDAPSGTRHVDQGTTKEDNGKVRSSSTSSSTVFSPNTLTLMETPIEDSEFRDLLHMSPSHHESSSSSRNASSKTSSTSAKRSPAQIASDTRSADGTPLHKAASRGNAEIVTLLVKSGANLEALNGEGKTALHLSVEGGHSSITLALADLGADLTMPDDDGSSVFHKLIAMNDVDMLRRLLSWCAEGGSGRGTRSHSLLKRCINLRDGQRRSLLYLAVDLERVDMVQLLVQHGADVNTME